MEDLEPYLALQVDLISDVAGLNLQFKKKKVSSPNIIWHNERDLDLSLPKKIVCMFFAGEEKKPKTVMVPNTALNMF